MSAHPTRTPRVTYEVARTPRTGGRPTQAAQFHLNPRHHPCPRPFRTRFPPRNRHPLPQTRSRPLTTPPTSAHSSRRSPRPYVASHPSPRNSFDAPMRSDASPTKAIRLVLERVRARVETRVAHNSPRLLSGGGYLQQGCRRFRTLGVYCLVSVVSRFWHVYIVENKRDFHPPRLGTSDSEGPPFHRLCAVPVGGVIEQQCN